MKRTLSSLVIALFGVSALSKSCTVSKPPPLQTQCFVGGCASEVCSDEPDVMSICLWRDELVCYKDATCERQKNGKCGWTQTADLKDCLENPPVQSEPVPEPAPVGQCFVGGCSGQLCTEDQDIISTCEWREEYACYESATCERQTDGQCGWTSTNELQDCLENPPQIDEPVVDEPIPADYCYVTGCSGTVCSSEQVTTTCEWRDEFVCYQAATCERQADGECGWTNTEQLDDCLANPPAEAEPTEPVEGACYVGGCSNEVCSDDPTASSICLWADEYTCYQSAACERQTDGQCGWTETAELQDCLANPPSAN